MPMLLSALSFTLAFAALWFACELAKRLDQRGRAAMKPHMEPVTAALQKSDLRIRQLAKGLEQAEREIQLLRAEIERRDRLAVLTGEMPSLAAPAGVHDAWRADADFVPSEPARA